MAIVREAQLPGSHEAILTPGILRILQTLFEVVVLRMLQAANWGSAHRSFCDVSLANSHEMVGPPLSIRWTLKSKETSVGRYDVAWFQPVVLKHPL